VNKKSKIIIVDDDKVFCKFVESLLQARHFDTLCIHTLSEAESFFSTSKGAHTVLLDYMLKDEKSSDLARKIRESMPQCFLLMMSGYPQAKITDLNSLLNENIINDFIEKPFSFPEIEKYLR
jgi:DNA-binding response OmpR family regulator